MNGATAEVCTSADYEKKRHGKKAGGAWGPWRCTHTVVLRMQQSNFRKNTRCFSKNILQTFENEIGKIF